MRKRLIAGVLLVSMSLSVPAFGIFGIPSPEDLLIWLVLRPIMHRNQDTQIANQILQLQQLAETLQTTRNQFDHLKESALGQIGAITDPIADLIATPANAGRSWADDFTGEGATAMIGAITDLGGGTPFSESWRDVLAEADTVSDADLRALFPERPVAAEAAVAAYQERRALADRRLELIGVRADAAGDLEAVRSATGEALTTIAGLVDTDPDIGGPNRSPTGLAEGDALATIAQLRTLIEIGQSRAVDATARTEAEYDAEVRRREFEALRLAERTARDARWAESLAGMAASRESRLHSLFGYDVGSFYSSGRND